MQGFGCENHIVLPFPAADFQRIKGADSWLQRFERVLSHATSVTITSDHRAHGSTATFEYANLIVSGKARLRAQVLDARLSGVRIRNAGERSLREGATSLARLWRNQRIEVQEVILPSLDITAGSAL